ncbi:MAG: nicotinate phosphoribosyltransferase [Candidatus Coatesbacteria bacterium]|nr:nicotinate phosphoribosyltransferase [Candidatus Coatesbacteria bacterium]
MSGSPRERLAPAAFDIPEEAIRSGRYTDSYFVRARQILLRDENHPNVTMQIFQRNQAIICGTDEAIATIRRCTDNADRIEIKSLFDGDEASPYETVMAIEGDYAGFAHLETIYLGILARRTKIATNTRRTVNAANGKPVLFFGARFDHFLNQQGDGYAAHIGGAQAVSTDAQGEIIGQKGAGTIPHGLIAAYAGDTALATQKFAEIIPEETRVISLVDFDNDCVSTALAVAKRLGSRLWGVRLDTSGTIVDRSVIPLMGEYYPTGVNEILVHNVRDALDREGFGHVKIVASGGFNPERIARFEANGVPVDAYGVGSYIMSGSFHYTADVVLVDGRHCAKVGRKFKPNPRLRPVE